MKQIKYHRQFLKGYSKRVKGNKKLEVKFKERLSLLLRNPEDKMLRIHQLKGDSSDFMSFFITGDMRVIYKDYNDSILLIDVGSHNQVY